MSSLGVWIGVFIGSFIGALLGWGWRIRAWPFVDRAARQIGFIRSEGETDAQFRARIHSVMTGGSGSIGNIATAVAALPGISDVEITEFVLEHRIMVCVKPRWWTLFRPLFRARLLLQARAVVGDIKPPGVEARVEFV